MIYEDNFRHVFVKVVGLKKPITIVGGVATLTLVVTLAACGSDKTDGRMAFSSCLATNLPASSELTLVGVYEGLRGKAEETYPVSDRAPTRIFLTGGYFTKPQVVVVAGHDKIIWDFSKAPSDKILGVITYGHSEQSVANLPEHIPLKQLAYVHRKSNPPHCGLDFSVSKGGPKLDRAMDQVERVTGLKITRFRGAYRATSMPLNGYEQQTDPEEGLFAESGPYAGIDPRERADTWPGSEVIAELVANGSIRPATQDDIIAWNKRATGSLKSGHLAEFKAEYLQRPHAYVLQKRFDIPDGVRNRSFIFPEDIPVPSTLNKSVSYYFMKTGKCGGLAHNCPGERTLPFGSHPDSRPL